MHFSYVDAADGIAGQFVENPKANPATAATLVPARKRANDRLIQVDAPLLDSEALGRTGR